MWRDREVRYSLRSPPNIAPANNNASFLIRRQSGLVRAAKAVSTRGRFLAQTAFTNVLMVTSWSAARAFLLAKPVYCATAEKLPPPPVLHPCRA